jgi:integrase/recombinase XerD
LLMLGGGLRVAEVSGLRVGDFDGRYLQLHVLRKGDADRAPVGIGAETALAIQQYLTMRGAVDAAAPLFMATPEGQVATAQLHGRYEERPLTTRAIRAMVNRRCNQVFGKGHGITPHTMRHALATREINAGSPVTDVSDLLGHKSTRITHTYLQRISGRGDRLRRKASSRYADLVPIR